MKKLTPFVTVLIMALVLSACAVAATQSQTKAVISNASIPASGAQISLETSANREPTATALPTYTPLPTSTRAPPVLETTPPHVLPGNSGVMVSGSRSPA